MKLRNYTSSLEEKMSEFDMWVTPSLGEIRDTEQFKTNLEQLKSGFDYLAEITGDFKDVNSCASSQLANNSIAYIEKENSEKAIQRLGSICNVLLLATGKTDNNLKCQFPLMLRNEMGISTYPQKSSNGVWKEKSLPRVLQMDDVTKIIVQLAEEKTYQSMFASSYFHLIISDEEYARQLWSLGNAYVSQKKSGDANSLLGSIVVFQSRGSITATQGHIPETILRSYMNDWGLNAGLDYNTQDVEVGELLGDMPADNSIKKRKYDFIVPYQSRSTGAKIFIQCQFYAGDSGSVSHKVVDQTDSTRLVTSHKFPEAKFVEYLDGAGYFASLNGDLRKMLAKATTKDFIQIRTAPLKLRRELQGIYFLTTLEIEHAILQTLGEKEAVIHKLSDEGYSVEEIDVAINSALSHGLIKVSDSEILSLSMERIEIVRKYCLLDIIANFGEPIPFGKGTGYLFVAGYSTLWGMPQDKVIMTALEQCPMLDELWENKLEPFNDLQWLIENRFVILK